MICPTCNNEEYLYIVKKSIEFEDDTNLGQFDCSVIMRCKKCKSKYDLLFTLTNMYKDFGDGSVERIEI